MAAATLEKYVFLLLRFLAAQYSLSTLNNDDARLRPVMIIQAPENRCQRAIVSNIRINCSLTRFLLRSYRRKTPVRTLSWVLRRLLSIWIETQQVHFAAQPNLALARIFLHRKPHQLQKHPRL